jgi:glycine/D-amino acid oxidase-like deaminating enzyme/nitrite reductase/ring-hydroxylating ferredoxin subunit
VTTQEIRETDSSLARGSLWSMTSELPRFPAPAEEIDVDVAVVGGGITGVSVAHRLKAAGKRVALLEMGRIGQGTTGYTTAKLTVGQSLVYARLRSTHGPETAKLFADSNREAIVRMGERVAELGIECDWEGASNYVYTESSGRLGELEDELEAMRDAGITAELTRRTELPFPVAGAIRVDDQAQLHPLKYLAGLAVGLPGEGSHVFEGTRATAVRTAGRCVVETNRARIHAGHIVLATQLPFLDRALFFALAHPRKSYAVAAMVDQALAPKSMYIGIDEPTRSIRSTPGEGQTRCLIVGGESGRPGEGLQKKHYEELAEFMRDEFGAEAELSWSAHDYMPADGLPYIGRLRGHDGRIHVATGFAKWGLTKATIAAGVIGDAILDRPNPWARLYDAGRLTPRASARAVATENAQVARRFLADRLRPRPGEEDLQHLAPGAGALVRIGGRHLSVYRDDSGARHVLSARCPHLGCIVGWNDADRTWECPCHGSRFSAEGELVQGPATRPLDRHSRAR